MKKILFLLFCTVALSGAWAITHDQALRYDKVARAVRTDRLNLVQVTEAFLSVGLEDAEIFFDGLIRFNTAIEKNRIQLVNGSDPLAGFVDYINQVMVAVPRKRQTELIDLVYDRIQSGSISLINDRNINTLMRYYDAMHRLMADKNFQVKVIALDDEITQILAGA